MKIINTELKKEIARTLMGKEFRSESKKGELVSLREMLSIIKYRNNEKETYLSRHYEELRKRIPYLTNINLHGDKIFLHLNVPPRARTDVYAVLMIMFKNNQFTIYNEPKSTREEQDAIKENQDLLKDIYEYSMENKYDETLTLNTISNLYQFSITDNELFLHLSLDVIKGNFYIMYDPTATKEDKIITTSEGPIIITSNVLGVERLFFKPKKDIVKIYYKDEPSPALRFLNHTFIHEQDLPENLTEIRRKMKMLSK